MVMNENVYDRVNDYGSVKITLASPNDIRSWSFGEVKKPETINYRTYRPEKDGLFCERIFECACGKYKGTKYKGIICDRCGVKVTHSRVRRKRMGHINLAAPIMHIWFFKALPSRLGTLLAMKTSDLEKIIYFQDYVITDPGTTELEYKQVLTEDEYRAAVEKSGSSAFTALMGAEAVRELLERLQLEEVSLQLREDLAATRSKQKIKDISKRLKLVEQLRHSENDPAWMVMDVIPRHQRSQRPVPADHQPQQPAQEADGPQRPRGHHPQRETDAPAGGGCAVRQRPVPPPRAGFVEPPAQVADRHDQGQAGTVPREPAWQAR
jgi:DNA-directed RNA polymerase subunit beta'